jgi:ComF family protein
MTDNNAHQPRKNKLLLEAAVAARDYLFPPLCVICDALRPREEAWLCAACIKKLRYNGEKRKPCICCGQNLRRVRCSCREGSPWNHDIESVFSIFDFDPTVKDLLHQIKYRGKKSLAAWTGSYFADRIPEKVWSGIDAIVPIPLHKKREKSRGYNQSFMFAKGIASVNNSIPVLPDVVKRVKNTVTQTSLNRDRREANMEGAFVVTPERRDCIQGRRLLLIDDVVTTGITTKEAAKALRAGGCAGVKVLSIARD